MFLVAWVSCNSKREDAALVMHCSVRFIFHHKTLRKHTGMSTPFSGGSVRHHTLGIHKSSQLTFSALSFTVFWGEHARLLRLKSGSLTYSDIFGDAAGRTSPPLNTDLVRQCMHAGLVCFVISRCDLGLLGLQSSRANLCPSASTSTS